MENGGIGSPILSLARLWLRANPIWDAISAQLEQGDYGRGRAIAHHHAYVVGVSSNKNLSQARVLLRGAGHPAPVG